MPSHVLQPRNEIDLFAERARWRALTTVHSDLRIGLDERSPVNDVMPERQSYVLAVDDDQTILKMVDLACRPFDLNVSLRVAPSVHGAIDLSKRVRFDMVLLDNELEGVRGWELLDYLRPQLSGNAPVVVYSGHLDARARAEYARRNVSILLEKPLSLVALGFWIRKSLGL